MEHRGLVRSESWQVVLRLIKAGRAFSKGEDCFFVFLSVCSFVHRNRCIHIEKTDSTKRWTPDSVQLFTLMVRSYSSYPPPVKVTNGERKIEELWERGSWLVLSL